MIGRGYEAARFRAGSSSAGLLEDAARRSHAWEWRTHGFPTVSQQPSIGLLGRLAPFLRSLWEAMNASRRTIGRCRAVVGLLAVTWLPYVSTHCIGPLEGGCPMLPASHEEAGASGHAHGHSHDHSHNPHEATRPGHHDRRDGSTPAHTCCELTGKYAFAIGAPPPSVAPAVVLVTIPSPAETPGPLLAARPQRLSPEPTQHAPPYLRFATLLI